MSEQKEPDPLDIADRLNVAADDALALFYAVHGIGVMYSLQREVGPVADIAIRLRADLHGFSEAVSPEPALHRECQVRFVDLDPPPRPPDMPARRIRVVQGGKR